MDEDDWPPRSPREVLLTTPGGRERLRRLAERTSPSPTKSASRLRTARSASALVSRSGNTGLGADISDDLDDDEDDEETLQLKLQAIQARLKLKKLQASKAKNAAVGGLGTEGYASRPESAPGLRAESQSRLAMQDRIDRPASQNTIQIPASPVKKVQSTAAVQKSPQRILLGIDKGKRAADMTLKRVSSVRNAEDGRTSQQGGYLRRSKTPLPGQTSTSTSRPMSFNERLEAARVEETERKQRQEKLQGLRNKTFDVSREEMEEYKSKAADLPEVPTKLQGYSRDDILGTAGHQKSGQLRRSNTTPSIRSMSRAESQDGEAARGRLQKPSPAETSESDTSAFEPYSGLHLSKRVLPHKVLARSISGKTIYLLKDLLKNVKAPDWALPDVESDIVVFAIIASKSDPRNHRAGPGKDGKQEDRGKYMAITLVDLTYEIKLYLFNSGFDRFWKLTPGTVIAILNPIIMPPPPGQEATGRFGLVINSDADTILEIGNARDLGFCKSVKKDGHLCSSWVNARRAEHCEFHTNEAVRRTRSDRMEFNSSGFGDGPKRKSNSREIYKPSNEKADQNKGYDRFTMSHYYVSGSGGGLLDDEREGGRADRTQREEALKRRMTAMEKEREIAKQLSQIGNGAGRDYLTRISSGGLGSSISSSSTTATAMSGLASSKDTSISTALSDAPKLDAVSLGLIRPRGQRPELDLGVSKRKRPESSQSSSTAGGSVGTRAALGWGATLKDKLGRMKEGERLDSSKGTVSSTGSSTISSAFARGERSPVRKKTRFVTEKGIREAGRESLGEPLSTAARGRREILLDDDDDDDLVIV
ncbi:hypothetical protein GQ53DRAFT_810771 [Thozetella sp. PMI_491]|nr:hypothetical protein GQ53DRAFT_810771 [Thozetella sp. PMI_491]